MRYTVHFKFKTYVFMVKLCNGNKIGKFKMKSKMADNIITCANVYLFNYSCYLTCVIYEQINHFWFKHNVFFLRPCNDNKIKALR